MAIYFDPRYDREYFYSIIKPLCLIYNQIVIWSPNKDDLEEHQFPIDDFIKACKPKDGEDYPVIIPAGRDRWFHQNKRKNHPDFNDNNYTKSFDSVIYDLSHRYNTIIPSEYDRGYIVADLVVKNKRKIKKIEKLREKLIQEDSGLKESFERVLQEQNRDDMNWAIANSYIQDIDVLMRLNNGCKCLNGQNLSPLVLTNQTDGYYLVSEDNYSYFPNPDILKKVVNYVIRTRGQTLPELPKNLNPNEVIAFLNIAFNAKELDWSEILKYRKHTKNIRNWLQNIPTSKRLDIKGATNQSIINCAKIDGREVYEEIIKSIEQIFTNKDDEKKETIISDLQTFLGCEIKDNFIYTNFFKTKLSSDIAKLILNPQNPFYNRTFFMDIPFLKIVENNNNSDSSFSQISESIIVINSKINDSFKSLSEKSE